MLLLRTASKYVMDYMEEGKTLKCPGKPYSIEELVKMTGFDKENVKGQLLSDCYGGYVEKCSIPNLPGIYYRKPSKAR